ncbi:hypothetical protein TNCV_3862921 [Trichonephila clavipes]|uniref:Transposase n=1 Tax=Trichonephila clavipes TaxID=2585209 RepID=A0A8X6SFE5_TRICX|nr:hypothetical protein TNCV_3862921 [Trichonephila clavipes]
MRRPCWSRKCRVSLKTIHRATRVMCGRALSFRKVCPGCRKKNANTTGRRMLLTYRCAVSGLEMTAKGVRSSKMELQTITCCRPVLVYDSQGRIPTVSWTSPDTSAAVVRTQIERDSSLKTIRLQSVQFHVDLARLHYNRT